MQKQSSSIIAMPMGSVRRQVCQNTVIPAKVGIQMRDVNPIFLGSRLRGSDGKTERVDGLLMGSR